MHDARSWTFDCSSPCDVACFWKVCRHRHNVVVQTQLGGCTASNSNFGQLPSNICYVKSQRPVLFSLPAHRYYCNSSSSPWLLSTEPFRFYFQSESKPLQPVKCVRIRIQIRLPSDGPTALRLSQITHTFFLVFFLSKLNHESRAVI